MMKEFRITDLVKITGAKLPASRARHDVPPFTGVSTDSRSTKTGDCFFAISGENFDGHDYICDAFAKGAVCAVVSKDIDGEIFAGKCLLKVEDTIRALGDLAREYRRKAGYKVVAITLITNVAVKSVLSSASVQSLDMASRIGRKM